MDSENHDQGDPAAHPGAVEEGRSGSGSISITLSMGVRRWCMRGVSCGAQRERQTDPNPVDSARSSDSVVQRQATRRAVALPSRIEQARPQAVEGLAGGPWRGSDSTAAL